MTDKRDLRKRLQALARGQSPAPRADETQPASSTPEAGIVYRRDLPRRQEHAQAPPPPDGPAVTLDEVVNGVEVTDPAGRRAWLIEQPLADLPGGWNAMCQVFAEAFVNPEASLRQHIQDACGPEPLRREDLIFLDLETTGLNNLPVFLIGTMVWEGDGFVVRQFFARDYAEERAILWHYSRAAAERKLLVSFNGKSFDAPYVRVRSAGSGVPCIEPPYHLDLLHAARRTWRGSLPDCRLQTLERHICKRHRTGDIPGELIPAAYHAFVRTGNAAQMAECIKHNRLDLITLADILTRLPAPGTPRRERSSTTEGTEGTEG